MSATQKLTTEEALDRQKIESLFRTDSGKLLLSKIELRKKWFISSLTREGDVAQIYRAQGAMEILNWLLTMKGE